jgi:transposase
MPAPVPLPLRRRLWRLAQQGLSAAELAARLGLPLRTAQHLRRRFRQDPDSLGPCYRPGPGRPRWAASPLRDQALAMRQQHPLWGAGSIRVRLRDAHPGQVVPSERTLLRWFGPLRSPPAPPGPRPHADARRACQPHEAWQMDAADQQCLRGGAGVCWLRLVDEGTGAFLQTAVFPPAVLGPRPRPAGAGAAAPGLRPLGPAAAAARGQRQAVGVLE